MTATRAQSTHRQAPILSRRRANNRKSSRTSTLTSLSPFTVRRGVNKPSHIMIPDLFASPVPLLRDRLETTTSRAQRKTVDECLPFLLGSSSSSGVSDQVQLNEHGVYRLRRSEHVAFLRLSLERMTHHYVAYDASRPWILYWCLQGLSLLGEDISMYRARLVETARWMQHEHGGFGGGFGQLAHLAPTYAVVLALCIVGGPDAYNVIDRDGMCMWLSALKQTDGGFAMTVGGEVDVRGAYCAAVIISLLNLPLEISSDQAHRFTTASNLFTGLAEYIQRCQTYEGGMAAKPGAEAHGAYAFCALGCLSILGVPHDIIPRYLNLPLLMSWLASRQYAPEGGFSGRTNKLVDGCYSHWAGGCWPLVETCLMNSTDQSELQSQDIPSLYCRPALVRYVLNCGQDMGERGGCRDKPSLHSDPYHTCYVLAGLSSAQHSYKYLAATGGNDPWEISLNTTEPLIFSNRDRLEIIHPVYAIHPAKVVDARLYFSKSNNPVEEE